MIRKENGVDDPKNEIVVGSPTIDPKQKTTVEKYKQRVKNWSK
jgi:hypothetical protein